MIRKLFVYGLITAAAALAAAPEGWYLAGSKPGNYETGVDQSALLNAHSSGYLKAKSDSDGFGTLMQNFSAEQYKGKRVRFSAWVKSENVTRWAGLWMRIDGPGAAQGAQPLAFDNMQSRPIKGTSNWTQYSVVLDVSDKATGVFFGILLDGPGEVWINSAGFDVVGDDVPTTGSLPPTAKSPTNLGFDK